jgi:DNA-binding transcriptional LysR family regulator
MDLKSLETFVWVVKLGSFRVTAEKLNMTQPAVSQRIAGLERELGRQLLERKRRAIGLTPAGREALLYAEKLLRLRSEFINALTDKRYVTGFVRIGASESIAHTWLSTFMKRVSELYPALSVEMEVDSSANLRERLLAQSIELAFSVGPFVAPNMSYRPLCTYPVAFFASPRLGLGQRKLSIADLAAWPIITFARNTQPYERVRELFNGPDSPLVRVHASASLATAVKMALDGTGVAAIPVAVVGDQLKAGTLEMLSTDLLLPPLNFVASWLHTSDALVPESLAGIGVEIAAAWTGSGDSAYSI